MIDIVLILTSASSSSRLHSKDTLVFLAGMLIARPVCVALPAALPHWSDAFLNAISLAG